MIAKSDLFILLVSASLLASGIYRWQSNLSQPSAREQQATHQQAGPASAVSAAKVITRSGAASQTAISSVTSVQTSTPVTVNAPPAVSHVVINKPGDSTTSSGSNTSDAGTAPLGSYIVVSGDYLSKIAQRYDTTVQTLQEINNINGTLIEIGQEIRYPLPAN